MENMKIKNKILCIILCICFFVPNFTALATDTTEISTQVYAEETTQPNTDVTTQAPKETTTQVPPSSSETQLPETQPTEPPTEKPIGIIGDMNEDGKLKIEDAKTILALCAGVGEITSRVLKMADADSNGVISINDVTKILKLCEDYDVRWSLQPIKQLTPLIKGNISAKAKYIEVTSYCAETLPETPVIDRSNPIYSPLVKGTLDYIKSGPVSYGDKSYYVLNSGRRVYADAVKVYEGYKLPNNKAQLRAPVYKNGNSTEFYIALDWRVPFNVQIAPQEYENGYDNRDHNVKDGKLTVDHIDIAFRYTDYAEGKLTFPESKVIKSAGWFVNKQSNIATLRIYLREVGKFYGYTAYYDSNNLLVISVKEPLKSLEGKVIELDPGHGGAQPGAVSSTGVYESSITYPIALKLKSLLEAKGATVVLSRDNGKLAPEIEERRINTIINNPDLFVSIHLDSSSSSGARGSSAYYYKNYSAPLAFAISKNLPTAVKTATKYDMPDKGAHYYPFMVTRVENCPAVLVECGFISNSQEFKIQNSEVGKNSIARGICNGIVEYMSN